MAQSVSGVVNTQHLNHRHRKKSRAASRVTNGSALLPNVDGRSVWVRRVKDLRAQYINDLGGEENISFAEEQLANRVSVLITEIEYREMCFSKAGHADDDQLAVYQTCTNTLRRMLEALGLQRRAKRIGPSLGDLLRADQEKQRRRLAEDHDARQQQDAA
jgi:hypothetical protein